MNKTLRIMAIAALGLVALVALGYAAGGGRGASTVAPPLVEDETSTATDDVQSSIDRLLGREQAPAQTSVKPATSERNLAGSAAGAPQPANDAAKGAPAQSGTGAGTTTTTADPLSSTSDRKIVQTASMRLQVKEVGASFEEVGRIATAVGGFVASSNFSLQGEQQIASVTIRVPATRYQEVLSEVRRLGVKVDAQASNASDVTEEFSDLSARQRTLEATEAQLLQFLGQAKNVTEVLQIQDRLNSVRAEIERVKGRMALLDRLSDLATLTIHMRPVVAVAKVDNGTGVDLGREVSQAWDDSLAFLGGIAAGVLGVVVFSWWVLPLAVLAYPIIQRLLRSRPAPPRPAPEAQ